MELRAQIKRRANRTGKVERKTLPKHNLAILVVVFLIAGSVVAGIISQKSSKPATVPSQCAPQVENPAFKTPHSLAELLALSPDELEHCDIARMNLLCAEGLHGAENVNVDECLATLDQWAVDLQWQIDRNFHHYQENQDYYYNSTNFYKMLMMASILYSHFSIRYDPKWIAPPEAARPDDHFFAVAQDVFLHGLIGPMRVGTCSSMPVLDVALGRRLGYPLKLVSAKGHFFLRWDSLMERFNMDATGKGMNKYDDERYKHWPYPISDEDIKADGFLQSMTPAQELSSFLSIRAACLHEAGRIRDEIAAHAAALRLEPNWRVNQWALQNAEREYAGISAADLADAQPQSQDPQEIVNFAMWKDATLNRLRSAELGTPETPRREAGLPVFLRDPIP